MFIKSSLTSFPLLKTECTSYPLVQHNIVFAEYYSKKRAEGKTHRVALSHVAKKFVRMIYTMQIKNITFDYDLAH